MYLIRGMLINELVLMGPDYQNTKCSSALLEDVTSL